MSDEGALALLLHTTWEVLQYYTDLKSGAGLEFVELENNLRELEAFLKDVDMKFVKTNVLLDLEMQIKELVYEVEDIIEICLYKKAAAARNNHIFSVVDKFSINLPRKVKSIRERIKLVQAKISSSNFHRITYDDGSGTSMERRQPHAEVIRLKPEEVVDFEDEKNFIQYLIEPKDKLDVITITGMPGSGKTTLAWKLYQNKEIIDKFEFRIWIDVSHNFNSRNVFSKILKRFTPQETSSPNEEELAYVVHACLEDKKFLLVFDDVFSVEDWNIIKQILPTKNRNGKVLVTTRQSDVAIHAHITSVPHNLKLFSKEKCWELLQLKVFENLNEELVAIGKQIAYKCCGVPLVVVVIGGILKGLCTKTQSPIGLKKEWENVLKNMDKISVDGNQRITTSIELSYDRLPNKMKQCFLYLGVFPKNEEISTSTLTQLWIAEGFLRPQNQKNFEETEYEILYSLINMNLLMVEKKHLDQIKTCRVHDMIRNFCISKAGKENFFHVVKESGEMEPPITKPSNLHRLCMYSEINTLLAKKTKGICIRSFLCFNKQVFDMKKRHVRIMSTVFKLSRVLNCSSIRFSKFPKLSKLILLKHITLSVDNLDILPKQISQLFHLITLVVETNSHSIIVKANIWKMNRLRHVQTNATMLLDDEKWEVKSIGNLETLTRLSPKSCTSYLYHRASNLKMLGVGGELANCLNTMSLESFHRLERLKLVNEATTKSSNFVLPQPDHFPLNLKMVTLSKTDLDWKIHMPILAKIVSLEVLKLKDNAFMGVHWHAIGIGFQKLEFLLIDNTDLNNWEAPTTYFLSLRCLVLRKCRNLKNIPSAVAMKLEKLEIEHIPKEVIESAKIIQSQKNLVKHSNTKVTFQLIVGPGCN